MNIPPSLRTCISPRRIVFTMLSHQLPSCSFGFPSIPYLSAYVTPDFSSPLYLYHHNTITYRESRCPVRLVPPATAHELGAPCQFCTEPMELQWNARTQKRHLWWYHRCPGPRLRSLDGFDSSRKVSRARSLKVNY